MARDPVLQWAADAKAAEQATGVPASVLLGLVRIESGGREGLTSSAGARGLTQFIPSTARAYGVDVRPGHARSQLIGAGKYLKALGFEDDPTLALRKYNGGTNATSIPSTLTYARNVLAAARDYTAYDGGASPLHNAAPDPSSSTDSGSSGGLVDAQQHSTLVRFGVSAALVLAAVIAVAVGVSRAAGVRSPLAEAAS